jgi:hypothetical protein
MGTGSDFDKGVVVTGLCRLLANAGIHVPPFKSQNMSNNAAVCLDGGEIGRAQAVQAEACGLELTVDMNAGLETETLRVLSESGTGLDPSELAAKASAVTGGGKLRA